MQAYTPPTGLHLLFGQRQHQGRPELRVLKYHNTASRISEFTSTTCSFYLAVMPYHGVISRTRHQISHFYRLQRP